MGLAPVLVLCLVFGHVFGAWAVFVRTRRAAGTCCGSALRALCRSQQAPAARLLVELMGLVSARFSFFVFAVCSRAAFCAALVIIFSTAQIVRQTYQKIYLLLLTFG